MGCATVPRTHLAEDLGAGVELAGLRQAAVTALIAETRGVSSRGGVLRRSSNAHDQTVAASRCGGPCICDRARVLVVRDERPSICQGGPESDARSVSSAGAVEPTGRPRRCRSSVAGGAGGQGGSRKALPQPTNGALDRRRHVCAVSRNAVQKSFDAASVRRAAGSSHAGACLGQCQPVTSWIERRSGQRRDSRDGRRVLRRRARLSVITRRRLITSRFRFADAATV